MIYSPKDQGARLKFFSSAWKKLKVSKWFLRGIRQGFKLPFATRAQIARQARRTTHQFLSKEDEQITAGLAEEYVKLGAAKKVSKEQVLHCSPVFPVPKSNGGNRMVLNAKRLNKLFRKEGFKMETLSSILEQLKPGLYATKIDLRNAYLHVPIWDLISDICPSRSATSTLNL